MTYVQVGNPVAIEAYRDPSSNDPEKVRYREVGGERVTTISFPEDVEGEEAFQSALTSIAQHIKPGEKPAWIDSDDKDLKDRLQGQFKVKGKPRKKTWGTDTGADQVPPPGALASMVMLASGLVVVSLSQLDLRTYAGRDLVARVVGDTGSDGTGQYAPANWIGLTANSDPPDANNTTLAGEITTGTLARAQAVFAHTNGTDSYTLTKLFTSDQSVTVAKAGVFNASTAGAMAFETLLDSVAILESGDQLQSTQTVTM